MIGEETGSSGEKRVRSVRCEVVPECGVFELSVPAVRLYQWRGVCLTDGCVSAGRRFAWVVLGLCRYVAWVGCCVGRCAAGGVGLRVSWI